VEPGETPRQAAARELHEETGLVARPAELEEAGRLRFRFGTPAEAMDVALFRAVRWSGTPAPSDELDAPAFHPVAELPLAQMWRDNPHWLPQVLEGTSVDLTITYDETAEQILSIE
jgi:8-oxo-dGTP diphosphatase